jgi:hypothetical protein
LFALHYPQVDPRLCIVRVSREGSFERAARLIPSSHLRVDRPDCIAESRRRSRNLFFRRKLIECSLKFSVCREGPSVVVEKSGIGRLVYLIRQT